MKNILLVEDDPFMIDIYTTKLKEAGFSVQVAVDGEEALNKMKEKRPDLLVLDIVLPRLTGFELLKTIRSSSKLQKVPVLILSNLGQKREVEEGLKLGAIKYLIKAYYTPTEVVKEIKEILK